MAVPSTIKLKTTINFATTHTDLLPLTGVGGITDEPGLSICTEAASEIINDENDWKWNSVELCSPLGLTQGTGQPLIIYQSKQDYLFAGASAFTMNITPSGASTGVQSSGASIDLASNSGVTVAGGVVTVKTLEPHRFAVGNSVYLFGLIATTGNSAKYNSTFTDNGNQTAWGVPGPYVITGVPTANSFTFAAAAGQANSDVLGAPGIINFGWLTAGTMMELNNNSSPMNVRHLSAMRNLPSWSKLADPEQFAVMKDFGTGVLLIRMVYAPAAITWIVNLIYQQPSFLYTSLNQVWGIPDNLQALLNQAVLYRAMRYIRSPSADNEYKILQALLQKQRGSDQAEQSNVFLEPVESLVDYGPSWAGGGGGF
jgi:hypothetical protein